VRTEAGIHHVELLHARLPLVRPFVTRHGARANKDVLLVHLVTRDGVEGWGECAAEPDPTYAPEHVDGAWLVLRDHLVPRLLRGSPLGEVAGNHMAKAALEMAQLDARLRSECRSLASWLGGSRARVEVGVVVERYEHPARAAEVAAAHAAEGYRRIKVKIVPGSDRHHIDAIRNAVGAGLALWADANGAYTLDDSSLLASLDIELLEQPLPAGDLLDHAALRSKVPAQVCLDESIASIDDARLALHVGAADCLALKPGRLGGLANARDVHDLCRKVGVPVWCGGMLETGIGRAANLALAALPGFTLPGDLSATDRYFAPDITEPFVLGPDGCIAVPDGPGLGVTVDQDELATVTVRREVIDARITDG
jgi:O-succinylbenzoate synthase